MIGLVFLTGFTALAVLALLGGALSRSTSPGPLPTRPDPTPVTGRAGHTVAADHPSAGPASRAPDASAASRRNPSGREILSMRARLAFVHNPTDGVVVLDCTLDELDDDPDDAVPAGTPFTLQLRLPETAWFASSLEHLLEQWAEESRSVEIALLARDGHAKAHVGDGSSRLMLEVDAAAGLSVS